MMHPEQTINTSKTKLTDTHRHPWFADTGLKRVDAPAAGGRFGASMLCCSFSIFLISPHPVQFRT
jgi:hypothetical protein